jgi:hypothetical protein
MKTLRTTLLSILFAMLLSFFMTGCVFTATSVDNHGYRHHHRHVWIGEIYYDQVYYIDTNTRQEVIVEQKELKHRKPAKYHHDNGNHGNNKGHN